jgi:hypothetical protein
MIDIEVFLPVWILLAIVGIHTFLVQQNDLAAPSGGGFAMFSTFDDITQRHIQVAIKTDKGWKQASLDDSDQNILMVARSLPTQENLLRIANRIRIHMWKLKDQELVVRNDPNERSIQVRAVRISFLKTHYDSMKQQYSKHLVRAVEIP